MFVRSEYNEADVFTKNTNEETYLKHRSKFMTERKCDATIFGKGVGEQ